MIDLAAYGFPLPEGIPAIVGPFNLLDARMADAHLRRRAINDPRAEGNKRRRGGPHLPECSEPCSCR
jgi:hypothetical protein